MAKQDDVLSAAQEYIRRGWAPTPLRAREKMPRLKDWPTRKLSEQDLARSFRTGDNVGIVLGPASGGLVDVDIDCPQAQLAVADFLPPTGLIHGRPSKPSSHWWYKSEPSPAPAKFSDIDGACLIEIRAEKQQTAVPPSLHPSRERHRWERNGEPARISAAELRDKVAHVAAATLLARHWPAPGTRHEASLALAGMLNRAGWGDEDGICKFVTAVARAAGDEEFKMRAADVRSTIRRREAQGSTTGRTRLAQLLSEKAVERASDWLGLDKCSNLPVPAIAPSDWPSPLEAEALYGLPGDIVKAIGPQSEADPAALLVQTLAAFGNTIGRLPYFKIGMDRHTPNLFVVLVGDTSKARKGTSWSQVRGISSEAAPDWARQQISSGLSSGEGLIWAVRDETKKRSPIKKEGRTREYEWIVEDDGIADKRLLVVEQEFASTLRVLEREGSTLSAFIRQAWDSGELRVMTKNSATKATGAHISIIGHIVCGELQNYLSKTEMGNGFANRFLFVCVRRSKVLPEGGEFDQNTMRAIVDRLRQAIDFAQKIEQVHRDREAREIWHQIYGPLSEGKTGLLGSVISRAEAQVLRLSMIYALMDFSAVVRAIHLRAAVAVWDYCEASARHVFGDKAGDPLVDEIWRALRARPQGMSRTDLRDLSGRNKNGSEVERALAMLLESGRAKRQVEETGGRPSERWYAATAARTP